MATTGFGEDADTEQLSNLASSLHGSFQETPHHLPSICQAFLNLVDKPDKKGKECVSVMSLVHASGGVKARRRSIDEVEGGEEDTGELEGGGRGLGDIGGGGSFHSLFSGKRSRRESGTILLGSPP